MNARRRTLTIAASLLTALWPNLSLTQVPLPVAPVGVAKPLPSGVSTTPTPVNPVHVISLPPAPQPVFYVRSYQGKCLDFGAAQTTGTQVYISDCNNSTEQQVRVEEVDAQHDVVLHAGSKVLGTRPPQIGNASMMATTSASPASSPVFALELQDRANPNAIAVTGITSASQTFALDGDSIILASDHTLVVQVQNARGANGSPLVVATRALADSEFWDFNQIAGADIDPTSGFVRAGYPGSTASAYAVLLSQIQPYNSNAPCQSSATPGTVIQIYPGTDINLTGLGPLQVPGGVTVRGSRRGTLFGPLVHQDTPDSGENIFEVCGNDVRITGLRLQGTSRSTDLNQPYSGGVLVDPLRLRTIIDHNDLSSFTNAGVIVTGTETTKVTSCASGETSDPLSRPYDAFITRNFFHHNEMQDDGYGVGVFAGGFPLVVGNMFYLNRHAISGDGSAHSGYRAWFNLVLEDSPVQHVVGLPLFHTQDFDMHGTGDNGGRGFGGIAGDYVQIYRNTFLGTDRPNYEIRGIPCNPSDFDGNVSLRSSGDAVSVQLEQASFSNDGGLQGVGVPPGTVFFNTAADDFNSANPTDHLGVGDFDGDHVQDLFLATGTAWYFAPQGTADWRFLSAKTDPIGSLIFGDFDGDGRTDVATMNGNALMVSWGGVSDWEVLNTVNAPITDLAVGKFANHAAGDRCDDIFWADGAAWHISSCGSGPFTVWQTSSARVKDLRFGDFDGNGTTDVLAIIAGKWMVSYNGTSDWIALPKSLTNTMDGVVVADFDGDGRADIATSTHPGRNVTSNVWLWQFSSAGATDWTYRYPQSGTGWALPIYAAAAIGNFDGNSGADVLTWGNDQHLYIVSGGSLQSTAAMPMYSREDLR